MSTAVLMSGQFRTFSTCLPTQHWHVYRHFHDLHFFVVMQNTLPPSAAPNAPPPVNSEAMVKLLEDKYGKDRVHAKLIDDPTDLPMIPKKYGLHSPYENAAPHPQLLMQHWYQNEVWKLFKESGQTPDTIIRMRGDNFFHSLTLPQLTIIERLFGFLVRFAAFLGFVDKIEEPLAGAKMGRHSNTVYSPWFGRFGGINDRFAIMDYQAAKSYFTVYERIDEFLKLGCPFHPETLLKTALEFGGVKSNDKLFAEFYSCRVTGNHRPMETLPVDMAHLTTPLT